LVDLDNVATFGKIWNKPDDLAELKDCIGFIDVYTSIASISNICYPTIGDWDLIHAYHPALKTCVANSLSRQHTILTGPNRGGKSTFCRTIGLAVILAQSWGFAYAEKMRFRPFQSIYTVLEPCGKLGVLSTFEAEIEFAKQVLSTEERPMFVMMDEIFHSTNALDGIAASRVFLQKLYSLNGVQSIISTHYTQLANEFAKDAQPLQLLTEEKENGDLKYTYKVGMGVSNKSSVMEILRERGLA
jgi:DNA mismatch repair ATPase MutS